MLNIVFIGGMDPSGGAGLAIDIPVAKSLQTHPLPIVSVQTAQNTTNVIDSTPAPLFQQQLKSILHCNIAAIKIGLIAEEHVNILASFISKVKVPVIFDPIIRAGGGYQFHKDPYTLRPLLANSIVTPNMKEAQLLTNYAKNPIEALFDLDCKSVVLTDELLGENTYVSLYGTKNSAVVRYPYQKQKRDFHGSGCLFTSSLIAYFVKYQKLNIAVEAALQYCQNSINGAYSVDAGQLIPKIPQ